MRNILKIVSLLTLPLFVSCEKDDNYYSLGDIWISLGFIDQAENDNSFTILLDNGDTLCPIANAVPYFKAKDSMRVMANYTILDEVDESPNKFFVKINNLYDILYKEIIPLTNNNSDSLGNDPIKIKDIWISKNVLNVEFNYAGSEKIHYINLAYSEVNFNELNQPIELEFRHNANNDKGTFNLQGLVSFNLEKLKQSSSSDTISILVKSIDIDGQTQTFRGRF